MACIGSDFRGIHHWPHATRILTLFAAFLVLGPPRADAQPGAWIFSEREDPDLVKARQYDPYFQRDGALLDLARAETLYRKFISENPGDEICTWIYFHMGHMYQDWLPTELGEKYGIYRDDAKALELFELAAATHPQDKVSGVLIDAKVSAAALRASPAEQVSAALDVLDLIDLQEQQTDDELASKLWFSSRQLSAPNLLDRLKRDMRPYRESLRTAREVCEGNVMVTARSDKNNSIELLHLIVKRAKTQSLRDSANTAIASLTANDPQQ